MISRVPGTLNFSGGGPGPLFRSGRLLTVLVRESGARGLIIETGGKRFSVSSDIPLQKGDIFVARVETGFRGVFLRILESPGNAAAGDVNRLSELMRQEPELVRALMRSGRSLKDENLQRFRRYLGKKKGKEREEYARYLTLLDEKNILALVPPENPSFLNEKSGQDNPEGTDTWREAAADSSGIRSILLRTSETVTETALFNHKKSGRRDHWMKMPLHLKIGDKTFTGELRLRIGLEKREILDGTLKLIEVSEGGRDTWLFGITDRPGRTLYLIEHPEIDQEKLAGFVQKVRKLGFGDVDTLNREDCDGFSVTETKIARGVDARA